MMTDQEISNALRQHLAGLTDAPPIVWENLPGVHNGTAWKTPDAPFWAVTQVKTPPVRPGLDNWHKFAGRLVVAVMVQDGTGVNAAETQAEAIIARFAANTKLAAGDGKITIVERPYADDGYNDGAYWRVNVHVRWQAME